MAKNDTARSTDDSFPTSTTVGNNTGWANDEVTEVGNETVFTTTDTIPANELKDIDLDDAAADEDVFASSASTEPMMNEARGGGESIPPSAIGDIDTVPATFNADASTPHGDLKEQASQAVDSAKDAAATALDSAKQKAGELAGQAKDQVKSQLSDQKMRAADGLGNLTTALRQTGDVLQQNGLPAPVADYAQTFAGQVDRLSGYLRDKDIDDVVRDIDDYARKNPMVIVGGAFLLGVALARFLKSSESKAAELRANAASRNNFGTAQRYSGNGDLVPVEGTYRGDLTSRTEEGTSRFSEDALPDNPPLSAHGYVPGIGVTHTDPGSNGA